MWARSAIFYKIIFSSNVLVNTGDISRIMLLQSKINSQLNTDCVHIIFFCFYWYYLYLQKLEKNVLRIIMDCVHIIFFVVSIDITFIWTETEKNNSRCLLWHYSGYFFLEFCIIDVTFLFKMKKRTENHELN